MLLIGLRGNKGNFSKNLLLVTKTGVTFRCVNAQGSQSEQNFLWCRDSQPMLYWKLILKVTIIQFDDLPLHYPHCPTANVCSVWAFAACVCCFITKTSIANQVSNIFLPFPWK